MKQGFVLVDLSRSLDGCYGMAPPLAAEQVMPAYTNYQLPNGPVKAGRRWGQRHPQGANLGSNGILNFLSKLKQWLPPAHIAELGKETFICSHISLCRVFLLALALLRHTQARFYLSGKFCLADHSGQVLWPVLSGHRAQIKPTFLATFLLVAERNYA